MEHSRTGNVLPLSDCESRTRPDVFCPRCGYDLRQIPEHRCPECGFGYDRRGIRSLSAAEAYRWDRANRGSMRASILSLALTLAPLLNAATQSGHLSFLLTALILLVSWWILRRLRDYQPPGSVFDSLPFALMVPVVLVPSLVVVFFPTFAVVCGTAGGLRATWLLLRTTQAAPFAELNLDVHDRGVLRRSREGAIALLAIATLAAVAAWAL